MRDDAPAIEKLIKKACILSGSGTSPAAFRRRAERTRGVTHQGRPGQLITMTGGREYFVAPDGSFRRRFPKAAA